MRCSKVSHVQRGLSSRAKNPRLLLLIPLVFLGFFGGVSSASAQSETARASAQSDAEAEEGVEVPPVVFEYESPEQRDIDTLLPEAEPISLPKIEPLLPEPEKMEVRSPEVAIAPPTGPVEMAGMERSFFSEGRIGVGLDNHLLGDIALYKRGESPHFSIGFLHEGTDGYEKKSSGTGYFHRSEELNASVQAEDEGNSLELRGSYTEREKGLQDYTGASSMIHRFTSGRADGSLGLGERFTLRGGIEGHYGTRVTAGEVGGEDSYSERAYEGLVNPDLRLSYSADWGEIFAEGLYSYYTGPEAGSAVDDGASGSGSGTDSADPPVFGEDAFHSVEGGLGFSLFFASVDISSRAAVFRDGEEGLLVPFSLSLEGMMGDLFHYRLGGGYRTERMTYRTLWGKYPLLDSAGTFPLTHGWNAEADAGGSLGARFDWSVNMNFFDAENYPSVDSLEARDSEDGLFSLRVDEAQLLESGLDFGYRPLPPLRFELGWEGELLGETERPEGRHLFYTGAELEGEEGDNGFMLRGAYRVKPTSYLPIIDTEAYTRISEGVLVRLQWTDILSPLVEGGREIWGEYLEPGMRLRIVTEISL